MSSNNASKNTGKNNKKKSDKVLMDKRFKELKYYAIFSVIALVAIVFVVNILFDYLVGKKLTYDFSASGKNSISKVTDDYLDTLPSDAKIRIVGLFDKPTSLTGSPYEYMIGLLDDYQKQSNGKITVEYINPKNIPSIITELDPNDTYNLKNVGSNVYVINYNGRCKIIQPLDCFDYDQTYYYQSGQLLPIANRVESKFTNAIAGLVNGYNFKAYFIDDSYYKHTQVENALDSIGIDSENIQLTNDFKIPADCDVLLITGLSTDITTSQAETIKDYIHDNGGKLFVSVEANNVSYTNLNSVLNEFNLRIDDYLISEYNLGYIFDANNPWVSKLDYATNYTGFASSLIIGMGCRPVTESGNPYTYISTSPVLCTSSNAQLTSLDATVAVGGQNKYNVGMHSEYSDSLGQEIYVFGTLAFTNDEYYSATNNSKANTEFIQSIFSDMFDINSSEMFIVEAKPIDDYSLNTDKISNKTNTMISLVFMAVLPLGFVIAGVVVYNKRKNL